MEKKFRSGCAIASLLDIMGDKWSLLIVRDLLIRHKKTFKEMSDSEERIAPSILSARLKLLESYGLIFKGKLPSNKKENIYLLTEKGIDLAPIIIEYTLWSDKHLRAYNTINSYAGLDTDKSLMIETIQKNYTQMSSPLLVACS